MSLPRFIAEWFKGKLKKNNLAHLPRASRKQRVDVSTRAIKVASERDEAHLAPLTDAAEDGDKLGARGKLAVPAGPVSALQRTGS